MANIERLHELIEIELDDCDKYDTPHVCSMASDPETRESLKGMIIKQVKESGISVGKAIQRVERAYNVNMIDD